MQGKERSMTVASGWIQDHRPAIWDRFALALVAHCKDRLCVCNEFVTFGVLRFSNLG
jgi:hypothetical protein